ncbi:hypothetical protein CBS101457_000973 [Exobasidium rhododendri]|nr:hypothetical protein CBS101457_000973 [Exobasidium rhododendri]
MDSTESVGYEVQSLFYQGAYQACAELVQQNTSGSTSESSKHLQLLYGARSHIALNRPSAALALLPSSSIDSPAAQSVRALATFVEAQLAEDASQAEDALVELNDLLDQAVVGDLDGQTIRVCVATAMARDDDPVGALEVLGMGSGTSREIECIALGVHILLSINRPDLAQREYAAARKWADDSLLIQLVEAHLGIYNGGRAAQQAYYVYDELAQNPTQAGKPSSVASLTGKAVARIVSGEYAEASTILTEALELDASSADTQANKVPIAYASTKTGQSEALQATLSQLRAVAPNHPLLRDLQEKEVLFAESMQAHKEAISAAS